MRKIKFLIWLLIVTLILASCSSSDKVVSNGFIQKRKYNKGYFVDLKGKVNKADELSYSELSNNIAEKIDNSKSEQKEGSNTEQTNPTTLIASNDIRNNEDNNQSFRSTPSSKKSKEIFNEPLLTNRVEQITKRLGRKLDRNSSLQNFKASDDKDLINLLLIAVLIALIIVVFSIIDGWLGGLLSLILFIFIILLLLRYFGLI